MRMTRSSQRVLLPKKKAAQNPRTSAREARIFRMSDFIVVLCSENISPVFWTSIIHHQKRAEAPERTGRSIIVRGGFLSIDSAAAQLFFIFVLYVCVVMCVRGDCASSHKYFYNYKLLYIEDIKELVYIISELMDFYLEKYIFT